MLNLRTKLYGSKPLVGFILVQHESKGRFLDLQARYLPFSFHAYSCSLLKALLSQAVQVISALRNPLLTLSSNMDSGDHERLKPSYWSFDNGTKFNPKSKFDSD